jgi:hypothetical protein
VVVKEPTVISPPVTESVLPIAPVEPIPTVVPQDQTPVVVPQDQTSVDNTVV